jgi:RecB family exonuclease
LAELQRWVGGGGDAAMHPFLLDRPAVQRGVAATAARASGGLSEWEGLVGRHPLLAIDPGRPLSPTALQRWAECPRRYLFERVLHVRETTRPEEVLQLNALDQGSLVHAALEQFFRERAEAGDLGRAWTDVDRVRLLEIVESLCDEAEAQGLTGKPVLWALQRRNLHEHLQLFLDHDAAHRAGGGGLIPQDFEVGFGGPDDPLGPLTFAVGSRTLRFHGRIDRIDASPDRSVIEVIDYKTGRSEQVRAIDDDCVDEGRRLQLPVYALAAARAFPDATITASYWFVTDTGSRHEHKPVPLTDRTRARFADVVGHIADGIEDGVFPGNPGEEDRDTWNNCRYCPYDRICPSQRDEIWERVLLSSDAAAYRSLRASDEETA